MSYSNHNRRINLMEFHARQMFPQPDYQVKRDRRPNGKIQILILDKNNKRVGSIESTNLVFNYPGGIQEYQVICKKWLENLYKTIQNPTKPPVGPLP